MSQHSSEPTTALTERTPDELAAFREEARTAYDDLAARGLSLDLTRGKPAPEQLDLADGLMTLPRTISDSSGTDVRNYGGLQGLADLREIFAELLGVTPARLVAAGNSSLVLMREVLVDLWLKGGPGGGRPWGSEERVRFLCPSPGYDRHFTLTSWFGIENVPVPLTDEGPDLDVVEALVAEDPSIKGMWVVPTYANPTGTVVSDRVAARLAAMETAADDFTIFWDNAYALHHLTASEVPTADLLEASAQAGNPERTIMFASTSKISWAGAGVGFLAGSEATVRWYLDHLGAGSIGPDKVNHLRHAQLFGSAQGVRDHMAAHRALIAPKFAAVDEVLTHELAGLGIAEWTRPRGGYFVSLDVLPGTAARVIELAKAAGVALTPAGSSFPGEDPEDRNIRLAPTFPELDQVRDAMEAVATCVRLAAAEKLAG